MSKEMCMLFWRWWYLRERNLPAFCSFSKEALSFTRGSESRPALMQVLYSKGTFLSSRIHSLFAFCHFIKNTKYLCVCCSRVAFVLCARWAARGGLSVGGGLLLCRPEVQGLCGPPQQPAGRPLPLDWLQSSQQLQRGQQEGGGANHWNVSLSHCVDFLTAQFLTLNVEVIVQAVDCTFDVLGVHQSWVSAKAALWQCR